MHAHTCTCMQSCTRSQFAHVVTYMGTQYTCTCMHIHRYTYRAHMYTARCVTCMCARMWATCGHLCTHIYTQAHAHTCTFTHTHTSELSDPSNSSPTSSRSNLLAPRQDTLACPSPQAHPVTLCNVQPTESTHFPNLRHPLEEGERVRSPKWNHNVYKTGH